MNISSKTRNKNFRKNEYFSGKNHVKTWENKHNRLKIAKSESEVTHENMRNLTNLRLPVPYASISLSFVPARLEYFFVFVFMTKYVITAILHVF